MLHFARTQIMQNGRHCRILPDLPRRVGEKDVPGVAAIHHPLRHVDSGPREVGPLVYVGHSAHRSAVDSHSKL